MQHLCLSGGQVRGLCSTGQEQRRCSGLTLHLSERAQAPETALQPAAGRPLLVHGKPASPWVHATLALFSCVQQLTLHLSLMAGPATCSMKATNVLWHRWGHVGAAQGQQLTLHWPGLSRLLCAGALYVCGTRQWPLLLGLVHLTCSSSPCTCL